MCESNAGICMQLCAKSVKRVEFGANKQGGKEDLVDTDDEF